MPDGNANSTIPGTGAYRPLDEETAQGYASTCPPLDAVAGATLRAHEVGDGNLNLIFIVSGKDGASAVIKQALPYVRMVGESWPLTLERNRHEREVLMQYGAIVPDLVPRIFHTDAANALFVMEDLSRLKIVRRGLIDGHLYPRLSADVARFSAETLLRSSDFYLTSAEKKAAVARSLNPELCKITEDLVLTDPFHDAPSNAYEPELQPVVTALWANDITQTHVALLRHGFVTRAEGLLHGDLHTGSIMASRDETKIMDAEFCFYGPMGFDIGMFIANLFLSAVAHHARSDDRPGEKAFGDALLNSAGETWDRFIAHVERLLIAAPVWQLPAGARADFMQGLLRDAVGYCGAEMIRRTIGLAHVADLEEIADAMTRRRAKAAVIAIGCHIINGHRTVDSFDQVVSLVRHGIAESVHGA